MIVVASPIALQRRSALWRRHGRLIGLVPTMGALHAGHAALIRRARRECDRVIVSIFVNPSQFGPREDLSRYPRPFREDRRLCAAADVDALFHPSAAAIYPEGFRTLVEVGGLSEVLEGEHRPGHFRGVATVVLKLFQLAAPDRAYFGEKDFQQLVIIRRMARDLGLPVRIVGCPTVREPDGLALSSRNRYLSAQERLLAAAIHAALREGARLARGGHASPRAVEAAALSRLRKLPGARVDHVRLVDEETLEPPQRLAGRLRLMAAVRLGTTRLIDNVPVRLE